MGITPVQCGASREWK